MKKIPIPSYLEKYSDKSLTDAHIWSDDISWIRANIPELVDWNDAQIIDMGEDDFGESQERRAFQTPLDTTYFKDYASFLALFDLLPKHIYTWDCEDNIWGLYDAFANDRPLDKWRELANKRRIEVAEYETRQKGPIYARKPSENNIRK